MTEGSGAARSLALLEERVASIPAALKRGMALELGDVADWAQPARGWVSTGTGGSEGPARVLVRELSRSGVCARFEPLSAFVGAEPVADEDGLVVFSQGLSPNARLALAGVRRISRCLLISAVEPDDQAPADSPAAAVARLLTAGGRLLRHGPKREGELLVRVVGPAVATLTALRLASAMTGTSSALHEVVAAVQRAAGRVRDMPSIEPNEPIALVHAGGAEALAHGLRWKLLECLGMGDPPVWDVLQLVHGPFQQFYQRPLTLLSLEHEGSVQRELFDRLVAALPSRHRLHRLRAKLPAPLGWFEHDAMIDALVLEQLRQRPRDLSDWPGKGADEPLYGLGRSPA